MVSGLKTKLLSLGFILLCSVMFSKADPMQCLRVYKFSGPVAMLRIPECSLKSIDPETIKTSCRAGFLARQDLSLCTLHLTTPLSGDNGKEKVKIFGSAVFSRDNGERAIDKASHLEGLMRYFSLHAQLLVQAQEMQFLGKVEFDDSIRLMLLKEALIRTAKDANEVFSSEEQLRKLASGSRATITLSVHGHIWIANIGHPKTGVWSMKRRPWGESEASSLSQDFTEARKGILPRIDEYHKEPNGRQWLVTTALESTDSDPDRRTWIEYGFDLLVHSMGREGTSAPNPGPPIDQVMDSQPLGMFQVVRKTNLTNALWEEGADIKENSMAELLVGSVITRDEMGNLAAVVIPHQNSRRDGKGSDSLEIKLRFSNDFGFSFDVRWV